MSQKMCRICGTPLTENLLHDGYECGICGAEYPLWAGERMEQTIEHIAVRFDDEDENLPAFYAT